MLKVIYDGKDSVKVKNEVLKAFNFVYKYFLVKIPDSIIYISNNRIDFDKRLNKKTAVWFVANASDNNEIDILSPSAIRNESSHRKNEFFPILKHEFTHLFVEHLAKGKAVPLWLNEGLASYVAKQHQNEKEAIYIEDNFCKKLSLPKGWSENINHGAYTIAAVFVYFLIKKYSFKKILKLIISLDKNFYYPYFEKTFFRVYERNLKEVEQDFIAGINK